MWIDDITAPNQASLLLQTTSFHFSASKESLTISNTTASSTLRKRICRKIASSGGFMTRPEWQKKKKKMAGREGPKKGKNR